MTPLSPIPFWRVLHDLRQDHTITTLDQAEALKGATSCCDVFSQSSKNENGMPRCEEYAARASRFLLAEGKLKEKRVKETTPEEPNDSTPAGWLMVDEVVVETQADPAEESPDAVTPTVPTGYDQGSLLQPEGEWFLTPNGR